MPTKIEVKYHANYNGCSVDVNEVEDEECGNEVVDVMHESCDDNGYCGCSVDYIVRRITNIVRAKYGSDAVVNVVIDTVST